MKALPWILAAVLAAATGFLFLTGKQKDQALADKSAQLQKLTDEYNTLTTEANARVQSLAKESNDKVEALVKEANEKIAYANLPVVPVKLSQSKAIFDSGLVLQIRNTSDKTIAITVSIERPSANKTKEYEFTIDSGLGKNIGQSEGWAFIAGDTVTVTQPDHRPIGMTFR